MNVSIAIVVLQCLPCRSVRYAQNATGPGAPASPPATGDPGPAPDDQVKAAAALIAASTSMTTAATRVIHASGRTLSSPRPPAMASPATAHKASIAAAPTSTGE